VDLAWRECASEVADHPIADIGLGVVGGALVPLGAAKVVENSQTAQRQAAARAMKPEPSSETPLLNPNMSQTGLVATGAKKTANAALNAVRPDATRSYGEVAKVLTETGAARDARIQSIIDALDRRQGNAAAAPQVGNTAALLSAIAANGALARRRDRQ
jgi:hypothetical protein